LFDSGGRRRECLLDEICSGNQVKYVNRYINLCQKYSFEKDDVILITSNLIEFDNYNFTLIQYML
jgi:hypothetical protein